MPFADPKQLQKYQHKYRKTHYKENKQYYKDKARAWKLANPDANKQQNKLYRLTHWRECTIRQRVRRYRSKHSYLRVLVWKLCRGHTKDTYRRTLEV